MYQMGLILFWVYDKSPAQSKTMALYEKTLKMLLVDPQDRCHSAVAAAA